MPSVLRARLLEQSRAWTPWDRRAWHPGTVLTLRELVEAASWCERGVLSDSAVQWLRSDTRPALGRDQGISEPAIRSQLDGVLKSSLRHASQERRRLERLIDHLAGSYMDGWVNAAGQPGLDVERASRHVTSHLLDRGIHPEQLRQDLGDGPDDPVELMEYLRDLAVAPLTTFSGWVLLRTVPEKELMERRPSWMPPADVAKAMRSIGETPPREQSGALRYEVRARDKFTAAHVVREELEGLVSRTRFLRTSDRLTYVPTLWLDGGSKIPLVARGPSVSAMSLAKTGVLYEARQQEDPLSNLDEAFELASHLIGSSAPVAVSNAWAAIESLLIDSGENDRGAGGRVIAADRAAVLVTSGWARAELTRLSHRVAKADTPDQVLMSRLDALCPGDNVSRCRELVHVWPRVKQQQSLSPADQAAVERISRLIANPAQVLGRVESYMKSSFRRLYRQRNLVMHGGALRPVAVEATARTAGPLVGALLDRLSVAAHQQQHGPLDAIAKAQVSLKMAKSRGDITCLLVD